MLSLRPSRRRALQMLAATGVLGAAALALWSTRREDKRRKRGPLKDKYLALVPSASPVWLDRVRELHERLGRNDHAGAAETASYLTDQALTAADRVAQAWLAIRDNYRGLLPRNLLRESGRIWNYKDCAADLYCHLVIQASLIAPANLASLRDILAKERAITAGLPRAISLASGDVLDETVDQRIFGAVEYAKDGLLPILERVGATEWLDRLHEVVRAIIEASPVETRFGRLPSSTTEKNGEFLQVLARLYRSEGREDYLVAGRAIADAYVHEVLPAGNGIPTDEWDFGAHRPRDLEFKLGDHGNEIVAGLAEWIMIEDGTAASRGEQYRSAIERMMDALLERGRDKAGLWSKQVTPAGSTPAPAPARPRNDNWGYLASAYVGYALSLPEESPRRERYLAECRRTFEAAIKYRSAAWEEGQMDGYADTIESAQYLLPYLAIDGAARWIDDEVGVLLAYQKPDGFCMRTYLDGNFVRTSLLYAFFRTQGTRVDPWRPGIRLGAIRSTEGLHLALNSDAPWSGQIVFDRARHREYLNLPYNYPRLNGWTEWFTAEPGVMYELTSAADGKQPETKLIEGSEMVSGVAVAAPEQGRSLRLEVQPKP